MWLCFVCPLFSPQSKLVCTRSVENVDFIRNILSLVFELGKLIKFSPKRSTLFSTLSQQLPFNSGDNATGKSLRSPWPTHWTFRHTAIESILLNCDNLKATLEVEKGHDKYAAKAHGMLIQLEMFDTFFGLKLAHLIFSTCEQFSISLQSVDTTFQEAIRGAHFLVKHLKSQQNVSKFDAFYMDVVCQASSKTTTKSPTCQERSQEIWFRKKSSSLRFKG